MYKLFFLLLFITWTAPSCTDLENSGPKAVYQTVSTEKQYCAFCSQKLKSPRYGGELTNPDGTKLSFRSVECVAGYVANQGLQTTDNIRVVDFIDAKTLLKVEEALFLHSPNLGSPNGMDLAAIEKSNTEMQEKIERVYPGRYIEWPEVVQRVIHSGYAQHH
ncbi:MAG: hypothetical protein WD266_09590 [Balneolales bacterium]